MKREVYKYIITIIIFTHCVAISWAGGPPRLCIICLSCRSHFIYVTEVSVCLKVSSSPGVPNVSHTYCPLDRPAS